MGYAIITLGGKQYVVREGEKLTVDRLSTEPGKTFHPELLFVGGEGKADLRPSGVTVTARVLENLRGEKVRIGKYRRRTGYKRHTGFRAALSTIQIETIGKGAAKRAETAAPKAEAARPADASKGLPSGYAEMTVAQVKAGSEAWNRPMLEAALAYEQGHGKRKGAIAALESAIAAKESH